MYIFIWKNLQFTPSLCTEVMTSLGQSLKSIGSLGRELDLAENMLFWTNWKAVVYTESSTDKRSSAQTLTLSGNPQMVMWNRYLQGTVSSVEADCDLYASSLSYSKTDGTLNMNINVNTFYTEKTCKNAVNPNVLGWSRQYDNQTISFQLDVRSLMTAVAISSFDVIKQNFSGLEVLKVVSAYQKFRGIDYSILQMFDPLYSQMSPIYCLGPSSNNLTGFFPFCICLFYNFFKLINSVDVGVGWNCVVRFGESFGFPLFLHSGANSTYPTRCICDSSNELAARCNQFSFFAGVAVYDYTSNTTATMGYPSRFQPFLPILELLYVEPRISIQV